MNKIRDFFHNQSLFRQYFLLTMTIGFIMLISLFMGNQITNDHVYREELIKYEAAFDQMIDELNLFEDRLNAIFRKAAYNDQLLKLLANSDEYQVLAESKKWFQEFSEDIRYIIPHLRHSMLYSQSGKLLMSKGDYFTDIGPIAGEEKYPVISHVIDSESHPVFFVKYPVMEKVNYSTTLIMGYLVLLIDTKGVQAIVDSGAWNQGTKVAVYHQDGTQLLEAGRPLTNSAMNTSHNIVKEDKLHISDFKIVSSTPVGGLTKGTNLIKTVMYTSFVAIFIVISVVFFVFYRFFLNPIKKQTEFMENYKDNVDRRIEVIGTNEVSEMANKMNRMLDDIDQLNHDIVTREKKYYEIKDRKNKIEMIALRSQVNPHFLYNTFSCIRGIALYHDQEDIAAIVQHLSNFFRYSIKGREWVFVKAAFMNLNDYSEIVRYRFNDKYQIQLLFSPEIADYEIPKMLMQPLLENAIFHGLETKKSGWVKVNAQKLDKKIVITVEDNGVGIDSTVLSDLKAKMTALAKEDLFDDEIMAIGIMNVYHRLRLFYGDKADFEINSSENGTLITMTLPIKETDLNE